jgi:hypothetical protein
MKVIIVAMGRSGGYRLGEWISTELNHTYYHEPLISGEKVTEGNRIVKYLLDEWRRMDTKPEWDVLIGLVREGDRDCAISHIKSNEIQNFRIEYEVDTEWENQREEEILRESELMRGWRAEIEEIETDITLTYEGIYERGETKAVCELLGIQNPKYLHLLDTSNRLRKVKGRKQKPLL